MIPNKRLPDKSEHDIEKRRPLIIVDNEMKVRIDYSAKVIGSGEDEEENDNSNQNLNFNNFKVSG